MALRTDSCWHRVTALFLTALLAPPLAAQQGATQPDARRALRPQTTNIAPAAMIEPPPGLAAQVPAKAVMLRAGNTVTTLQSLRVTRQYSLQDVRAQPRLTLPAGKLDLQPLLANPQALFNVAQRMRAEPQLLEVIADDTRIVEVEQGLVVRSFLGYRLRTGTCTDRTRQARLARIGAHCFTQMSPQARAAAFANPADPHYVADPRRREQALRVAQDRAAEVRAQVSADIATLRTMLADPSQRAAIDAEIGAAEASRLAALDNAQLEAEIVNAGETRIEQVMFVPGRAGSDRARFAKAGEFAGVRDSTAALPAWTSGMSVQPSLPPIAVIPPQQADRPIEPRVFLTGFTLGSDYEWRQRVETTIKWCLVGCKKTYYVELYAGFGYGFGLRFPVAMAGTYRYRKNGTAETASLLTDFRPVDGSAGDYSASGLPAPKLFDGKELVAQFDAYAGAAYKVPIFGSGDARFDVGKDFTDGLPPPFTHGQFRPPMPGEGLPAMTKIFDDFDLIGGRANFGVVGGKVFPALKAELHSDALRFTLRDNIARKEVAVTASGQVVPLAVDSAHASDFTIGTPVYNLGFLLTPGIDARLFIDIEVWSDHWDWPVWFPQMAVQLPPGGVDFACHADTVCTRNYRMTPGGTIETAGATSPFVAKLDDWVKDFDARWLQQCTDDICKTGIRLVRTNAYLFGKQTVDAHPDASYEVMTPAFKQAETTAGVLVHESQVRLTQKAGKGWAIIAQAVWSKRCADLPCLDKVADLSEQMVVAAVARQKAEPDASSLQVQGEIGREFGPRFQAEIDASKARANAQALQTAPLQFHAMPANKR